MFLTPADKVGNEHEVTAESGLFDNVEFVIEPVHDGFLFFIKFHAFGVFKVVAHRQIGTADVEQHLAVSLFAIGHVEYRIVIGLVIELHRIGGTAVTDELGVAECFGNIFEDFFHLFRRLEVKLPCRKTEMLFVVQLVARLDTEHDLVSFGIFAAHVVYVVGRHKLKIAAACKVDKQGIDLFFLRHIVVHKFDEEVFRTEDLQIIVQRFFRTGNVTDTQFARNFSGDTR